MLLLFWSYRPPQVSDYDYEMTIEGENGTIYIEGSATITGVSYAATQDTSGVAYSQPPVKRGEV